MTATGTSSAWSLDGTTARPMLVLDDVHTYYGHIHALEASRSPSAGARSSP